MRLNGHTVVKDMDIFERVGHSTAHDETVAFSIKRGKLSVQREVSTFNGKLTVEFVKVREDGGTLYAQYTILFVFNITKCQNSFPLQVVSCQGMYFLLQLFTQLLALFFRTKVLLYQAIFCSEAVKLLVFLLS